MDASEPSLDELAGAILDGTSVDWRTIQSTASETERSLVEELRALATLADFHREQRADTEPGHPPEAWGHIRVLEPLGSGAFGRVYRAWDTRLDREVALKLLPARSDAGDARASSIIQEGRLLARVRHPNVVTIYGAERIGDTVGLWMELIDGETVEQRLAQGLPFQPSEAIEIGIQICRAVSAVHDAGLLHRDIKAQNVMLAADGRAVLMDFGTGWEMSERIRVDCGARRHAVVSRTGGACAAAKPRFRAMCTALACCSITCSPEPTRYALATSPICVLPTNVAIGEMSARSAVMCRVGWPASSSVRSIPMPSAGYESVDELATALGTLQPRRAVIPLKYAIAIAAALVVGGLLAATPRRGCDRQAIADLWRQVAPMAPRLPSFR